ncbi:hypothetical protein ACF3NG_01070 [Aerococcaceae bacterium WGS1372]
MARSILLMKKIKKSKPQAVTVCANGLVTSSILKQTLERLFPEFEFLSAMSEREFYNYEGEYDVVFSTTLLSTKVKQFHVNPLMSNEEQNQLRYNVLKNFQDLYNFEKYQELIEDIIVQVEKYSTIHDKAELTSNLKKLFIQGLGVIRLSI